MNVPYELNVQKAIRNKVKACDFIDLDVSNKGGNIICQLNTASFELARAVITNYYIDNTQLYTCEIINKTDGAGNIVEDIIRIANRRGRACKGGCLFTINFYRTTCKIMVNGKSKNRFYVNDLALIKDLFNKERDNILLVNNFVKVKASGSNVTNDSVPSKSVESNNSESQSTTIFASNSINNVITSEPEQNLNNIISTSSTNDSILNCYDPLSQNNFMSKPVNDNILSSGTSQSSSCTCACTQKLGEVLQRLDRLAGEIETIKTAVSLYVIRGVDVNTCSSITPHVPTASRAAGVDIGVGTDHDVSSSSDPCLDSISLCVSATVPTFPLPAVSNDLLSLSKPASSFPLSTSSMDLDLNHQTTSSSSFISLCETSSSSVTFTRASLYTDTIPNLSSSVSPRMSYCVNPSNGPPSSSAPRSSVTSDTIRKTSFSDNSSVSGSSSSRKSKISTPSTSSSHTIRSPAKSKHSSPLLSDLDQSKKVSSSHTKKVSVLLLGSSVISRVERNMIPKSSYVKTLSDKTINGAKDFISELHCSGYQFKSVCLQIGSNDIVHQSSESVFKNYQTLVDKIRSLWNCSVFISGILPRYVISQSFHRRRSQLNKALSAACRHEKYVHFVPQYLSVDQMAADGVHPKMIGCKIMVERLLASIDLHSITPLSLPNKTKTQSRNPAASNSNSFRHRTQSSFSRPSIARVSYRDALISPPFQCEDHQQKSHNQGKPSYLPTRSSFDTHLSYKSHSHLDSSYLTPPPRSLYTYPLNNISSSSISDRRRVINVQYETLV